MLSKLVEIDSTLGKESPAQEFMKSAFSTLNLKIESVPLNPTTLANARGFSPVDWEYSSKEAVTAIHHSRSNKGKSVLFNGHVDVVPVENSADQWTNPPFKAVVRDGKLYGRGAGDMKAGIIAFFYAFKALQSLGLQPAGTVYLQTVVEEECSGNGTLAATLKGYKPDAVIIPEPFPEIVTAQLGVMWLSIEVSGTPAHVLNTSAGINAIDAAFRLYKALAPLEERYNQPQIRPDAYKDFKHPINFNLGKIIGGDWSSSVPSKAKIEIRVGFFPNQSIESVKSDIESTIGAAAKDLPGVKYNIHYSGFLAEGCEFDVDGEMVKALSKAHEQVTGAPPKRSAITCTTDARFFQLYHHIPSTCYGPSAANIHGIDESVCLKSLSDVTKVLAVFIADWCGLEPITV
eukprot:TRINITY_DN1892_c0_g1_i1.p1 TRINITY_DN1892_c0_g1~~TRINITY_DN1892_c0_g1_i1.p1  ORF type:complete len:403 (+),score=86.99 TRINITY_DN1892_c0_g1_i1:227-1435(+)